MQVGCDGLFSPGIAIRAGTFTTSFHCNRSILGHTPEEWVNEASLLDNKVSKLSQKQKKKLI